MFPVIVCIAKLETDYIEEFVRYHLALGFKRIYIYDNEDVPLYEEFLKDYKDYLKVTHYPGNNFHKGVQYMALDHFIKHFMHNDGITHVAHIDVDEFISLKRHETIQDFISEFLVGDCAGIGMNWRFFGSSHLKEKSTVPNTLRFTKCGAQANEHIKTIFRTDCFQGFATCHDIITHNNTKVKSTSGKVIHGPHNHELTIDVVQLNHYKCKTLPEFRHIRTRQRADVPGNIVEDVDGLFRFFDMNDQEDLTAFHFYSKVLQR
jgi:hypothetical protein